MPIYNATARFTGFSVIIFKMLYRVQGVMYFCYFYFLTNETAYLNEKTNPILI